MIHFWSDTHFFHSGIIGHARRPDKNVDEMNQRLVSLWNSRVGARDEIYLLGDFGFDPPKEDPEALLRLFVNLNGRKHLIIGNHDEKNKKCLRLPWDSMEHMKVVKFNHSRVFVCHYPVESWPGAHNGVLHAHGHSHGSLKHKMAHRYDVGVDALGIDGPISWDELFALGQSETFRAADHHGDL